MYLLYMKRKVHKMTWIYLVPCMSLVLEFMNVFSVMHEFEIKGHGTRKYMPHLQEYDTFATSILKPI